MSTGLYTKYYRKPYGKKDREKYGVMQWRKNIVHLTQLQVVGLLQHRQHLSLLQLCLRPSLSVWSLLRSTPCPMFIAHLKQHWSFMTFHNEFSRIAVDAGTADQPLFPLI